MSPLSQLCHCIELDEEQVNFNVFIYNIVYHNLNKNKVEEVEIKVPEIKVVINVPEIKVAVKNEIIKKEKEVKQEVKSEIKPEVKSEVKKGPKTPAERQRERRERLKNQLGEEEFKKQNQKKMKEYRAKQQKEEKNDDSEDIDDDNVSTTSSTNNNIKLLSDETKITCECGICYHKSYKSRHLKSKAHLEGLEKMQTKKVEVKKMQEDEELENNKYKLAIQFVNSITDFDCRDNILGHENNKELYEELETYINRFINKKCNENQLNYDCYATIKEFIVNNDIKYEYDFFSEYLQNDPYDEDSESE